MPIVHTKGCLVIRLAPGFSDSLKRPIDLGSISIRLINHACYLSFQPTHGAGTDLDALGKPFVRFHLINH